jgi:hypothetical protein
MACSYENRVMAIYSGPGPTEEPDTGRKHAGSQGRRCPISNLDFK